MIHINLSIHRDWLQQHYSLNEPDDHTLELLYRGQVVATFSQEGVTIDNILKEVALIDRKN